MILPHTMGPLGSAPKFSNKTRPLHKKWAEIYVPVNLPSIWQRGSTFLNKKNCQKQMPIGSEQKTAEVFVFSIIFECVWKSMRKPPLVGCWAKNSTLLVYTLDSTINRRFVVKVSGETYC